MNEPEPAPDSTAASITPLLIVAIAALGLVAGIAAVLRGRRTS